MELLHIKINETIYTNILEDTYSAYPENVYHQAKRTDALNMIKVWAGAVYNINFSLLDLSKDNMTRLYKDLMKPNINIEFYDEYSGSYKMQDCYCKTPKPVIKRMAIDNTWILHDVLKLEFTANQKADWINNEV